jgi:Putative transmembrane protein (PGPGW)
VIVGIIMGPGLLVMAVGLAVIALELAWTENLLEQTVDRLSEAG